MPSTRLSSVFMVLDSSTVMTPSLETFSIASATISPTLSSEAEIAATRAIWFLPLTGFAIFAISSTALSEAFFMPLRRTIGFAPAARFFMPSLIMACARTVAVVVPSPATSLVFVATSRTSCAPMFSKGSSSSISFAIVTPSFVMRGVPKLLSRTTLRPFGPSVTRTVLESLSTPSSSLFLASAPNRICFAILMPPFILQRWL